MRPYFLLCVLACGGCVDPGGAFDDFARRSRAPDDGGVVGDGAVCTVSPGAVSGIYLLAISVKIAPTKPIVVLTGVQTPAFAGGTGVQFDAQPLSATDRKTPVGAPLSLGPFSVDSTGSFTADLPELRVLGAANPVTGGDILANVVLDGNLCGDGRFFCGAVSGNVVEPLPIDLQGSTFTLTEVDDPSNPPVQPAVDCQGTLADPLP